MAIVCVTHNVREAVWLGQRVGLLSSRPRTWDVDLPHPRIIADSGVGELSRETTARLREEVSRHARV